MPGRQLFSLVTHPCPLAGRERATKDPFQSPIQASRHRNSLPSIWWEGLAGAPVPTSQITAASSRASRDLMAWYQAELLCQEKN